MKRLAGIVFAVALAGCASMGQTSAGGSGWAGAWGASPNPPPAAAKAFENQTVRQVVRLSTGGSQVRIRFSNEYGDKPLDIGAATVSLASADGKPTGSTLDITFNGSKAVAIPPKAPMLSDPITLDVNALELALDQPLPADRHRTLHLPLRRHGNSFRFGPRQFHRRSFRAGLDLHQPRLPLGG
ncbi:MAG: hypothetical protein QM773_09210 [Hyphomonadaceae bacterium]